MLVLKAKVLDASLNIVGHRSNLIAHLGWQASEKYYQDQNLNLKDLLMDTPKCNDSICLYLAAVSLAGLSQIIAVAMLRSSRKQIVSCKYALKCLYFVSEFPWREA